MGRFIRPMNVSKKKFNLNTMPIWVLVLDYVMGMIMWTLIGRTAMNVFQREDSEFFFMRMFVKLTNPIIKPFEIITPSFIIKPLVPIYVAWFFYMFRFYFMPWALGYSVMGMLSFPLESEFTQVFLSLFKK
jgi:uncharacterized protein YggT (Ycf19 family)